MLEVQRYLQSGKTLADLTQEFGIVCRPHDSLPLVILNYDQIESKPKSHRIVRECRALVLHAEDYSIVAKSFNRFFNWGELAEEMDSFDFNNFIVHSKEDGSLALLYYYNNAWHANTRGSFAVDKMQHQQFTWRQGMLSALGLASLDQLEGIFDSAITYVCEFCSPWNKVVRQYEPQMFLLTAFRGETELSHDEVDRELDRILQYIPALNMKRPNRFEFHSIDEIQQFLQEQVATDPTFEGVVISDCHGNRWKIKNPGYLALHRLRGEGDNLFNPKNLLPFVLSGEESELLTYFPEVKEAFYACKDKVDSYFKQLLEVWRQNWQIEVQKDFALAIKDKTPFTGVLFTLRKTLGQKQTEQDLKNLWRQSGDGILKVLFRN
jgi:hypothetical protein